MNKLLIAAGIMLAFGTNASYSAKDKKEVKSDTVVLTSENTIILNAEVDGESTSAVISKAKELDAKMSGILSIRDSISGKKPIYLFLNTPGGSVQSGLELIEALKGIGRPVHTITLFAASMGFQIAQNLDTRHIIKSGVLMSHRAKGTFEGEFGGQSPSQVDSRYALWKDRMDEMDQQTADRTNGKQSLASYQAAYASELWRTGQKAVTEGYADKVVTVKCDSSLAGTTSHQAMILGIIPVTYQLDNCPLNTSPMAIKASILTNKGFMTDEEFSVKGGEYGPYCLLESAKDPKRLCTMDTSLNLQKIAELKVLFVHNYNAKMRQVVDKF